MRRAARAAAAERSHELTSPGRRDCSRCGGGSGPGGEAHPAQLSAGWSKRSGPAGAASPCMWSVNPSLCTRRLGRSCTAIRPIRSRWAGWRSNAAPGGSRDARHAREPTKADAFHIIHAGLVGGRDFIPPEVAEHPRVFVTLTAPSFGPVHTRVATGNRTLRCYPRGKAGGPSCIARHGVGDPLLGQPIDPGPMTMRVRCCGTRTHPSCGPGSPSNCAARSCAWAGAPDGHRREGRRISASRPGPLPCRHPPRRTRPRAADPTATVGHRSASRGGGARRSRPSRRAHPRYRRCPMRRDPLGAHGVHEDVAGELLLTILGSATPYPSTDNPCSGYLVIVIGYPALDHVFGVL